MQVFDYLLQIVLCLVNAFNVIKLDAVRRLYIDSGIALAHVEHHGARTAGPVHHPFTEYLAQHVEDQQRDYPADEEARQRRHLPDYLCRELRARLVQPVDKVGIVHHAGTVYALAVLAGEEYLVLLDLDRPDIFLFGHRHECAVIHFLYLLLLGKHRSNKGVEGKHDQKHHYVENYQRFSWFFYFIHFFLLSADPYVFFCTSGISFSDLSLKELSSRVFHPPTALLHSLYHRL